MIWTIKLAFLILLTTLTGSVLTMVWYGIGRGLEHAGYLNILYWVFRVIQIFWIIPIPWLVLMVMVRRDGTIRYGMMFFPTPMMLGVCKMVCLIWSAGVVVYTVSYVRVTLYYRRTVREACPCDRKTTEIFLTVCEELHLSPKRIALGQTYKAAVPQVTGWYHLTILLPMEHFTREELYFVFLHEMTHVRHRDLLAKNLACVTEAIHFFNPVVWWFRKLLDCWSEYACDYKVCVHSGNMRAYYEAVISMIPREKPDRTLTTPFTRGVSEVKQRIKHVKGCLQMKKKSVIGAVLPMSLILALSSSTVYAATTATAEAVYRIQEATDVELAEIPAGDELAEYTEAEPIDSDCFEEGEVEISKDRSSVKNFFWTLYAGYGKYGRKFRVTKGTSIVVAAKAAPSSGIYRLGIINPDGSRTFVQGSGAVSHTFTAGATGYYYVYVENISDSTLSIDGSYIY
ncbi:MAG: M56 family metallopeptidase [Clostridiales bacterium]|nr:M56 family metallopeptidase [Clostridiales bacterium]